MGITERTANDMFAAGAGVITTGNHVYRHREAYEVPRPRAPASSDRPTTRRAIPGAADTVVEVDGDAGRRWSTWAAPPG